MGESTYLCHHCRNIFKTSATDVMKCARCGSGEVELLPSWNPAGSNLTEGSPEWEYECQHCRRVFKQPPPASPSEEKEISCPSCGARHIHRLSPAVAGPLYCG